MKYDSIVVGAGIAGLSCAAYLSKSGYKVLLCDKNEKVGGLVNSFDFKGFTFDGGIRAIESLGILFPMLKQLSIDMEFLPNPVSIGIEKSVVKLGSKDSLSEYGLLLGEKFPESKPDIAKIIQEISKVMRYMDVLYGIDNPLFRDLRNDKEYLFKTLLPWLIRYKLNINKALKLNEPINEYLKRFTDNESLISVVAQHFFKETPAFFALSYFSIYLDYCYPKGGTGVLPEKLKQFILDHEGDIALNTEIYSIDTEAKTVETSAGEVFRYNKLVWAADSKQLYSGIDVSSIEDPAVIEAVESKKIFMSDKVGGDSVLTVCLAVDLDSRYFENICGPHMFYTPSKSGSQHLEVEQLKQADFSGNAGFTEDKRVLFDWVRRYYDSTTYEISCPAVRDKSLAPAGQTGLIVSVLMDYSLVKHIEDMGLYEEFKDFSESHISRLMTSSIFPEMESKVLFEFSSTPLTIQQITGSSDGAITGWAFTNSEIPAESSFKKIAKSIETGVPDVFQAGQWSFSPSGLPVSILTGKMAYDRVIAELERDGVKSK